MVRSVQVSSKQVSVAKGYTFSHSLASRPRGIEKGFPPEHPLRTKQKISPRSSSLGRKAGGAFAKAPFWQFRSHLATELIT